MCLMKMLPYWCILSLVVLMICTASDVINVSLNQSANLEFKRKLDRFNRVNFFML